jgi:hypothetical protein
MALVEFAPPVYLSKACWRRMIWFWRKLVT